MKATTLWECVSIAVKSAAPGSNEIFSLFIAKYRLPVKEIKIKVILYNLSRLMNSFSVLCLIEGFYRARILSFCFANSSGVICDFN